MNQVIEKLLSMVQETQNFFVAETPEYIRQLLEFKIWENAFWIMFFASILFVFIFSAILLLIIKIKHKSSFDPEENVSAILLPHCPKPITASFILIPLE